MKKLKQFSIHHAPAHSTEPPNRRIQHRAAAFGGDDKTQELLTSLLQNEGLNYASSTHFDAPHSGGR